MEFTFFFKHLPISFTKGVGIREVILTNGCPGGESKCIVRVEECRGPVDCGCELDSIGERLKGIEFTLGKYP